MGYTGTNSPSQHDTTILCSYRQTNPIFHRNSTTNKERIIMKTLQEIMASPKPQQPVKQICIIDALRQIAKTKN